MKLPTRFTVLASLLALVLVGIVGAPQVFAQNETGQRVGVARLSNDVKNAISAGHAWPMLLTGMLFCASVSAVLGFCLTLLAWRIHAVRRWNARRARRAAARATTQN